MPIWSEKGNATKPDGKVLNCVAGIFPPLRDLSMIQHDARVSTRYEERGSDALCCRR